MDFECYIGDCSLDKVLGWLGRILTEVRCVESAGILIYHAKYDLAPVSFVYTPVIEDGGFGSICCIGDGLPWCSEREMARDAFSSMQLPVRWPTETIDPYDWWELDAVGERRITWNDEYSQIDGLTFPA